MRPVNPLLQAWKRNEQTFGYFLNLPDSVSAEIVARQDLDYATVDLQHGLFGPDAAVAKIQAINAAGKAAVVRVPWNQPAPIMAALDMGAAAVIVPMINSPEEARAAGQAFYYPPRGNRSYGPIRTREIAGSGDPDALLPALFLAMVETADGIRNVEAIAAVDEVDGIYIGPADLSLALGLSPLTGADEPLFRETLEMLLGACRQAGVYACMHAASGAVAQRYVDMGFDMITVGSDASTLSAAVREQVQRARQAPEGRVNGHM
jgi:4-hydroxy-2-oxoheptanedioate aldolase